MTLLVFRSSSIAICARWDWGVTFTANVHPVAELCSHTFCKCVPFLMFLSMSAFMALNSNTVTGNVTLSPFSNSASMYRLLASLSFAYGGQCIFAAYSRGPGLSQCNAPSAARPPSHPELFAAAQRSQTFLSHENFRAAFKNA